MWRVKAGTSTINGYEDNTIRNIIAKPDDDNVRETEISLALLVSDAIEVDIRHRRAGMKDRRECQLVAPPARKL